MKQLLFLIMLILSTTTVLGALDNVASISVNLLNQDPDPAISGDIVELRISVENNGGDSVNDLMVQFVPSYPFELLPGENSIKEIGTIGSYRSGEDAAVIKYKVKIDKDAPADTYEFKINYYEAGNNAITSSTVDIDVKTKESAVLITFDKTSLIPGQITELNFEINNVGSSPLRDLTFSWENADKAILAVGSDNRKYIKYIEPEETAKITYKVIADTNVDAGLYELKLNLNYDDPLSAGTKELTTSAGMYVGGATDFEVSFSDSSNGETSFSIANIGSNSANSVSVSIPKQSGWRVTGSSSAIIGNLNQGDYTVASFALQSLSSIQKENTETSETTIPTDRQKEEPTEVTIQIAYTDTMGNRKTVDKVISLTSANLATSTSSTGIPGSRMKTTEETTFWSTYQTPIIVLILILVVALGYKKYKKNKK